MTKAPGGNSLNPYTIQVNPETTSYFWLTDLENKRESYALTIDGRPLGNTGAFVAEQAGYQTNPDTAIAVSILIFVFRLLYTFV